MIPAKEPVADVYLANVLNVHSPVLCLRGNLADSREATSDEKHQRNDAIQQDRLASFASLLLSHLIRNPPADFLLKSLLFSKPYRVHRS